MLTSHDTTTRQDALTTGRGAPDWQRIVVVFWLTSLVEGVGVSQVFALLPAYLAQLGVAETDRLSFVGLFSSLLFVLGLPLVPLWGVWADKYSRKAVIVRSAIVEAIVFGGMALSREPWQVAVSILLIGFQLGNTGVMLAGIRDVTPTARLGRTIAIFGASGPVGFALGPAIAGLLIDGLGASIPDVFAVSAALSLATALLVTFGSREVRPTVVPEGRVLELAFGAMRAVLGDPAVRRIFLVFSVSFLAGQTARPYVPILVEGLVGRGAGLASSIALVVGTGSLVGALLSPLAGAIGDRVGFRRVLAVALGALGLGLGLMIVAPSVPLLALLSVATAAAQSTVTAMVFGLLATEVAPERRSTTLNLVYLPLYAAGIIGPAISAAVVGVGGRSAPFLLAAAVAIIGAVALAARGAATRGYAGRSRSGGPT